MSLSRFVALLLLAVLALLAMVGCGGSTASPVVSTSMMNLPVRPASRCKTTPLRPACPMVIPRVPDRPGLVVSGPQRVNQFWVLDLGHGAPSDSAPRRNRPPGVLHVTVYSGNISQAIGGMAFPSGRRNAMLRDGIVAGKRPKPVLFGPVRWSGKKGALFLAPSYPVGGQIGGHLAFWWRANGTNYLVSIHAWEPLSECRKVLQAMVASTASS